MEIFNRPPTIAEDTLIYTLNVGTLSADKTAVSALATTIVTFVENVLPNHIWHRDSFELRVVDIHGTWHLEGRMRVGDSVDDEWCVVWLLREIGKIWDVVVSVYDTDGQFLLIEAAEHLPGWITPENAENRVWMHRGRLHIIPLNYVSDLSEMHHRRRLIEDDDDEAEEIDQSEYVGFLDGIRYVRDARLDTLASKEIEEAAFRKVSGYPEAARKHIHRTRAYLPRDIALALHKDPFLVQKAVETFYTRDATHMRAAARMSRFPPEHSVLTTVKMTRTAYAQLMGQKFYPPRIFGLWKDLEGSPEWRRKDLGMKIACGFEMVYQESKRRVDSHPGIGRDQEATKAQRDALRRDPEYIRYIQNLEQAGFFKAELEGSAAWNDFESKALLRFIEQRQADDASRPSFASLVNDAISDARNETTIGFLEEEEDSDEWLTITEKAMDEILNQTRIFSTSPEHDKMGLKSSEDKETNEQAARLRSIADNVEKFVEGQGDLEGAMFEDETLSDEDGDLSDSSDPGNENEAEVREMHQESPSVIAAERQAAMDRLVPALDPSEYGRMPSAFHTGSQKVREDIPKYAEGTHNQAKGVSHNEGATQQKPLRPLIFPRDEFDGVVDSDDESEEANEDEDEDEDQPTVVGEVEIDMREEEEDFLKFSREALGITPEMWNDIVKDRRGRGAFLPKSALKEGEQRVKGASSIEVPPEEDGGAEGKGKNINLDTFEAVMQAMDAELARAKGERQTANTNLKKISNDGAYQDKGKPKVVDYEDNIEDNEYEEVLMDEELRIALKNTGEDDNEEGGSDYRLMKNFLESFKSQQGLSGPVSNLIGRLGGQLPRDNN